MKTIMAMTSSDMRNPARQQLSDALRWALDSSSDPAMASADWLAADIDPQGRCAIDLVTDPHVPLEVLERAKSAFKTMRIVGETIADRRLGARLYLASIASALVHHNRRISSQSNEAITRSLRTMVDDAEALSSLRALAGQALCTIQQDAVFSANGKPAGPAPAELP